MFVLEQNRSSLPHFRRVRELVQPHLRSVEQTGREILEVVQYLRFLALRLTAERWPIVLLAEKNGEILNITILILQLLISSEVLHKPWVPAEAADTEQD